MERSSRNSLCATQASAITPEAERSGERETERPSVVRDLVLIALILSPAAGEQRVGATVSVGSGPGRAAVNPEGSYLD